MGPWGRALLWSPVATARRPRAIASSAACCRFSATWKRLHPLENFVLKRRNLCSHHPLTFLYQIALWAVAVSELAAPLVTLGQNFLVRSLVHNLCIILCKLTFSQEIRPWFRQRAHLGLRAPSPPALLCIKEEEDISLPPKDCSQSLTDWRFQEEDILCLLLRISRETERLPSRSSSDISAAAAASHPPSPRADWMLSPPTGFPPTATNTNPRIIPPATTCLQGRIGLSENETNSGTSSATFLFHLPLQWTKNQISSKSSRLILCYHLMVSKLFMEDIEWRSWSKGNGCMV